MTFPSPKWNHRPLSLLPKIPLHSPLTLAVLLVLSGQSCQSEERETDENSPELETGAGSEQTSGRAVPQRDDLKLYIFGNSLVVHEYTEEPSEEKKVPHWLSLFANATSVGFAADGRYGFMRDFADASEWEPQWEFASVSRVWTDESLPFSAIPFNRIIYTPTNFIQWQGAEQPYYDDNSISPLSTTLSTLDQIEAAHPGIPFYIYQGWKDMAEYGDFPETIDLNLYYLDAKEDYHSWFLDYQDRLMRARPKSTIKLIPVAFILSKILTTTAASSMTILDVYEDDAPHGQPSLYFLASLIVYTSLYQKGLPSSYPPPDTVHSLIRGNLNAISELIQAELEAINHADGTSRVY